MGKRVCWVVGSCGTLLGPEGTGARCLSACVVWVVGGCVVVVLGVRVGSSANCSRRVACVCTCVVGVGVGCGSWSVRSLRTVQWTRASFICGQVFKGARWMPWHQEPMKDVGACDKPRGAGNRAVIRGCPNGETPLGASPVTRA